jgi:ribonuclease HII
MSLDSTLAGGSRKEIRQANFARLLEFDRICFKGPGTLAGVDEAGRGPLAGPVVAAAVILGPTNELVGVNDSKKLSPAQREEFFKKIIRSANVGVGVADEKIIDALNIYEATRLAMKRAVQALSHTPTFLLVDGPIRLEIPVAHRGIVNGDQKSASIASASIVAKVFRDRWMCRLHELYPAYSFDRHKGYGTAVHLEALRTFGPSPVHRLSFAPVGRLTRRETAGV